MAKRANILNMIKNEMGKGNIYVLPNGNFTSKEAVTKGMKEDFIKALRADEIGVEVTLEAYTNSRLEGMKTCETLLTYLAEFFPQAEEAEAEEQQEQEQVEEQQEQEAPKKQRKHKGVDADC